MLLEKNASLISDCFISYSGSKINVYKNAKIELGRSYINHDCCIDCYNHIKIGDFCAIADGVKIRDSNNHNVLENDFIQTEEIIIGDHVWIGAKSFIQLSADAKVEIGDNVDIAPCVRIITGSHEIGLGGSHMAGPGYSSSVRVGNGCWVGASSVLLPGVNLPDMTVVAAGSVVTRSRSNSRSRRS